MKRTAFRVSAAIVEWTSLGNNINCEECTILEATNRVGILFKGTTPTVVLGEGTVGERTSCDTTDPDDNKSFLNSFYLNSMTSWNGFAVDMVSLSKLTYIILYRLPINVLHAAEKRSVQSYKPWAH